MLIDSPHRPDLGHDLIRLATAKPSRYPDLREIAASKPPLPKLPVWLTSTGVGDPPYWRKEHQERMKKVRHDNLMALVDAVRAGHDSNSAIAKHLGISYRTSHDRLSRALRLGYLYKDMGNRYQVVQR